MCVCVCVCVCEKYFIETFLPCILPSRVGEIKWKTTQEVFRKKSLTRLLHGTFSPVNWIAFLIAKPKYDEKQRNKNKN